MTKRHYTEPGAAGIKLLVTAMRRNIERVENRYRNKQTRETCQALSALCDGIWAALEEDRPFTVYIGKQLPLDFVYCKDAPDDLSYEVAYPSAVPVDYESSDYSYSQVD